VADLIFQACEQHALETPIGHVHQLFFFWGFGRQKIPEVPFFLQKGFYAAEFTGKQPVGLLKGGWGAALGALVVDG
jgi:hypothetical protein